MPPSHGSSQYLSLLPLSAGLEATNWHVSNLLMVSTPSVVAYHTYQLQGVFTEHLFWLTWQVLFAEWAVFCFEAFLHTARYGVQNNVQENHYHLWNEWVLPSFEGRIVP